MQRAWLSLDDDVKRRPIRTTKLLRGSRQGVGEVVTRGHAQVQLCHAAASVAHDTLHLCSHRFQRVFGGVGFLRQLIVDRLCLETQGSEILDERIVELFGDAGAVGGARLELRAKDALLVCSDPQRVVAVQEQRLNAQRAAIQFGCHKRLPDPVDQLL